MPSVTYSVSKPSAPESVQIITSGNYTVPAGKIAKVSANCSGGATVSLNGTVVLSGAAWDAIRINSTPFTINAGGSRGTAAMFPALSTPLMTGSTNSSVYLTANSWGADASTTNASSGTQFSASPTWTNSTASSSLNAEYTVPAGTIISTSSGRCVIEIYSA